MQIWKDYLGASASMIQRWAYREQYGTEMVAKSWFMIFGCKFDIFDDVGVFN